MGTFDDFLTEAPFVKYRYGDESISVEEALDDLYDVIFEGAGSLTALRSELPTAGRYIYLRYHTSVGDLGGGFFYGVTGASPGTYVDDDGTIILPSGGNGASAWKRVWDGQNSHVGWWGAKCDPDNNIDDIVPFKKALALYTNGRYSLRGGSLNLGRGIAISEPVYIGGNSNYSFKLKGESAGSRGITTDSVLKYIGAATRTFILAYGLNQSPIKDLNIYATNVVNAIHFVSDNQANSTLSGSVSAGASQSATIGSATGIAAGSALAIGIGSTFEVVYVRSISGTTLVADFRYAHSAGERVGGGVASPATASSGARMDELTIQSPTGFATTFSGSVIAGSDITITPASMSGIEVGLPLYVGSKRVGETIRVKTVGASTFTADLLFAHASAEPIILATSCILIGEIVSSGSVQVSEITLGKIHLVGSTNGYAGIRSISSGNVKNFRFDELHYAGGFKIFVAFEQGSGSIVIDHMIGAGAIDTLILLNGGTLLINGLEDESSGAIPLRGISGTNALSATIMAPHFQGALDTDDIFCYFDGALTIVGGNIFNPRTGSSFPKFLLPHITDPLYPTQLSLIGVWLQNVDSTSAFLSNNVGGVDYLHSTTPSVVESLKVAIIDCYGGNSGALSRIENFPAKALVSSRTTLKTKPPGTYFLAEGATYRHGGRSGWFAWDASVLIATHQADTQEGVYVPPAAGSNGAFVRVGFTAGLGPGKFGAVIDGLSASGTDDYAAALACADFCWRNGVTFIAQTGNLLHSDTIKFGASIHDQTALGKILGRIDQLGDYSAQVNSTNLAADRLVPGCDIRGEAGAAFIPTFTSVTQKAAVEYNHYSHAAPPVFYGKIIIATRAFIDSTGKINSDQPGITVPPSNGLIGFVNAYAGFAKGSGIHCYGMEKCGVLLTSPYFSDWQDIQGYACGQVLHVVDGNGGRFEWLGYYSTRGFVGDGDNMIIRSKSEQCDGDTSIFASGAGLRLESSYQEDVLVAAPYAGAASLSLGVRRRAITVGSTTGFAALNAITCTGSGATGICHSVRSATILWVTLNEGSAEPLNTDMIGNGTASSAASAVAVVQTVYAAKCDSLRLYNARTGTKPNLRMRGVNSSTLIDCRVSGGVADTDAYSHGTLIDCDFADDQTNLPAARFPRIEGGAWIGSLVQARINNASFLQQYNVAGAYIDLLKLDDSDRMRSAAKGFRISGGRPSVEFAGEYFVIAPGAAQNGDIGLSFYVPSFTGDYIAANFRADVIGNNGVRCFNYSANVSANARFYLSVLSTGGDPFLLIEVSGGTSWAIGADNSVSGDPLKISNSASPSGGSDRIVIDANVVSFPTLPPKLPSFTVAGAPNATTVGAGAMIYVSNESGGAVPAFSDATNWLRVTDRAVIS